MGIPSPFVTAKQSPFLIAKQRALQPSAFPELPAAVEMSPSKEKADCVISDKPVPVVQNRLAPVWPRTQSTFEDQDFFVRNTFLERAQAPESPLALPRRRAESDWTGLRSWEVDALAAELTELSLPPARDDKWCYDVQAKVLSDDSPTTVPDSSTSSDEAEERRTDPDDDCAYTLAEFHEKYGGRFLHHEVVEYWDCLEPTGGSRPAAGPKRPESPASDFLPLIFEIEHLRKAMQQDQKEATKWNYGADWSFNTRSTRM